MKIEAKIFDELKQTLSSFGEMYFVGRELNRSKISEDLRNYDEVLLDELFKTDFIKQHFIIWQIIKRKWNLKPMKKTYVLVV